MNRLESRRELLQPVIENGKRVCIEKRRTVPIDSHVLVIELDVTVSQIWVIGILVEAEPQLSVPFDSIDPVVLVVDAGEDYTTVDTLDGGAATDIPEDFLVSGSPDDLDGCDRRQTTVTVPDGAGYLFLAVEDDRYEDNGGDISVRITRR